MNPLNDLNNKYYQRLAQKIDQEIFLNSLFSSKPLSIPALCGKMGSGFYDEITAVTAILQASNA